MGLIVYSSKKLNNVRFE